MLTVTVTDNQYRHGPLLNGDEHAVAAKFILDIINVAS